MDIILPSGDVWCFRLRPEHQNWHQLIINQAPFHPDSAPVQAGTRFISKTVIENGELETSGNRFAKRDKRFFTRAIMPFNGSRHL